jgi:phosphinothricin acetyltransferase
MKAVADALLPWLVAEQNRQVVGYAYAGKWHGRSAYRFTAESTVYLHEQFVGCGLGRELYEALLLELRSKSVHAVIGGIALPNPASVALHEKLGFEKAAHYREVGFKFGRWIDVGYWQKMLS